MGYLTLCIKWRLQSTHNIKINTFLYCYSSYTVWCKAYRGFDSKCQDCTQQCRSVVQSGGRGQSGQAIKLFQVPQTINFTFHFWHKSFILHVVGLAELSNNGFEWKNVTFGGSRHALTPPTYFQVGQDPPTPMIYALDCTGAKSLNPVWTCNSWRRKRRKHLQIWLDRLLQDIRMIHSGPNEWWKFANGVMIKAAGKIYG